MVVWRGAAAAFVRSAFGIWVRVGLVSCGLVFTELAASSPPVAAQTGEVKNGPELRVGPNVFVVPDANARSITGWLVVKAGCADEVGGNCVGIAHYLEHLLFINRDDEHRSKVAFFPDGSGNGWTTHRATAYFQRFPSQPATDGERLDKLLGFFAGLLTDVRVDGPQAERERNVVLQEYQQNTGRNPFARFSIDLNRALMPNEPLGQRVIGLPETIRAFTPEAAHAFHTLWYTRDNAVIVLHGPIDPAAVTALVAKYIDVLPAKKSPANAWKLPRQYTSEQVMLRTREKDARQIGIYLDKIVTYPPTVGGAGEVRAAQAVLSAFLSSRLKESPLENLMERDGLVAQARLGVSSVREGALRLSFSGVPADGVDPEKAIEAARAYIVELAHKGLDQSTVDRLKLRIANERNLLAEQPGLYAQALVSWLSAHYSHEDWLARPAQAENVSVASINRLLKLLAGPGREVAGIMLPEAGRAARPAATRSDASAGSDSFPTDAQPLPQVHPPSQGEASSHVQAQP